MRPCARHGFLPLNHADGAGDFQSIDPLAVQYIEVWRGANALEYGANSLGGAVNFVTPTGRTAPLAVLRTQTGSFGARQGQMAFAGAADKWDGFLSVTHGEQDGYRDQSESRTTRYGGNVGLAVTPTLDARVYLNHVDSDMAMPGSLTQAAMAQNRRQAGVNYALMDAGNNYRMNRAAFKLDWTPSNAFAMTTTAYLADRDRFHPMVHGILDQQSRDTGVDTRAVIDMAERGLVRRLVLGASFMRYRGDERSFTNLQGSKAA